MRLASTPMDLPGLPALTALLAAGGVAVLSGAGLSTESGIPDYRGPSGSLRRRTPMTYQLFTGDPLARRRYWARSHLGWRHVADARPNAGHRALADLEARGQVLGVVTQNVDGLHTAAGARRVVDLHGRLDRVVCLDCGDLTPRDALDVRLRAANPGFAADAGPVNADGDVELDDSALDGFTVVDCAVCGGTLKPDVVYFGETVPGERVVAAHELVREARALLVVGSSLTVFSGRRFVVRACERGIPVAIVNQGETRADARATLKLEAPLGEVLPALAAALPAPPRTAAGPAALV